MEEKNWHSKRLEGDDINTKVSVLKRAVQPLIDKQKDAAGRSTAGYCVSMDRGYGDIKAQQTVWKESGIYTNSMIPLNSVVSAASSSMKSRAT
jgi:hypothetical protein